MIAKAAELLTATGFTLPLVGEDHPLRKSFRRTFALSAILAMLIHGAAAGGRLLAEQIFKKPPVEKVVRLVTIDTIVPPSLSEEEISPQMSLASQVGATSVGIPEPVPDYQASELTLATVDEMSDLQSTDLSQLTGGGDSLVVGFDEGYYADSDYEAVEENPVQIQQPPPVYPQIARVGGIEGAVILQVLIGEDGQVKDVRVLEGPEMFRQAAIDAARLGRYRPAQNQNRPVSAWVQIKINFSLS
jgi:protein TonB